MKREDKRGARHALFSASPHSLYPVAAFSARGCVNKSRSEGNQPENKVVLHVFYPLHSSLIDSSLYAGSSHHAHAISSLSLSLSLSLYLSIYLSLFLSFFLSCMSNGSIDSCDLLRSLADLGWTMELRESGREK